MTPQRIKDAAEKYADAEHEYTAAVQKQAYIAGATALNERAQGLVDALEGIDNSPTPYNEREMKSWIETARALVSEALAKWKGEGEQAKPIEYMPIHPEDAKKFDCPTQFPMHLLDEGQAMSNHSQSLKRLKERGGLSVREILAIVGKKPWSYYGSLPWPEAIKMLNDIVLTNPQK